jgi:cation diffusion facilitator family transporter
VNAEAADGGAVRRRAARVSLFGALVILVLKFGAYGLTGSVGFLSDAAESVVNLVAAVALMIAMSVAGTPPDYRHPYGHTKAEYLSSVLEATLIVVAAVVIVAAAVQRLLHPQALEHVVLGAGIAALAAAVNGGLAAFLFRTGRRERSAALEANARHLLTDVWTSIGVVLGVTLVAITGWDPLDPIIAILVASNIVAVGAGVFRRSVSELLDERLPEGEERIILRVLDEAPEVMGYHRLRTRRAGRLRFAEVDVFVDPELSVRDAHRLIARLEDSMHSDLSDLVTTVHVEPFEAGVRDASLTPREEFPQGR